MEKNIKIAKMQDKERRNNIIGAIILIPIVFALSIVAFKSNSMFFEFIGILLIYALFMLFKSLLRLIFTGLNEAEGKKVEKEYILSSIGAKRTSRFIELGKLIQEEHCNMGRKLLGEIYIISPENSLSGKNMELVVYDPEQAKVVYQKIFSRDELRSFEVFTSENDAHNFKIKQYESDIRLARRDLGNVSHRVSGYYSARKGGLEGMAAGIGGAFDNMSDIDAHNRECDRLEMEGKKARKLFIQFIDNDEFLIEHVGKEVLMLEKELNRR